MLCPPRLVNASQCHTSSDILHVAQAMRAFTVATSDEVLRALQQDPETAALVPVRALRNASA